MTDNSLSKIPYWDGKSESFGVYVSKIEAYAEFMGVGDALDPVLMANCPTKSEFAVLDVMNPTNGPLVELAFYIYGRFWSLSTKRSQKNGLYNIFYGRWENTTKFSNVLDY